jgi:hypothetical protein
VVLSVTVFEAAMGPMIGASIVAIEHELDPPLLTMMVGVGIPLSFLTLPVWWQTSKEGSRESEGCRRRRQLWGFWSCWRLLLSDRNDYKR